MSTVLDKPAQGNLSQMTQVEQARAVAEVQAAVTAAKAMPRDPDRAAIDMKKACSRKAMAEQAFYRVPNRGDGSTVHLARELARVWGNINYAVHELRRDDRAGLSEIQAYAWDMETNSRNSRTFIVPHQRMKKDRASGRNVREDLVDLGDVYLNNQNVGARAVRECIFAVLPTWFVAEAEQICRETLRHGDGKPMEERVEEAVGFFARLGVTQQMLEGKVHREASRWDEQDVASLGVLFRSIQKGDTTVDIEFDVQAAAKSAEILGPQSDPS